MILSSFLLSVFKRKQHTGLKKLKIYMQNLSCTFFCVQVHLRTCCDTAISYILTLHTCTGVRNPCTLYSRVFECSQLILYTENNSFVFISLFLPTVS